MGGSRGGGNRELEDLQKRALEEELAEQERLEADLEARRRLRAFGGRRGQLRFLGPLARQVRRSQERGQQAVTPATPSAQAGPTSPFGGTRESSPGVSLGRSRGRETGSQSQSGRSGPTQSDPGAFDTGGGVFG